MYVLTTKKSTLTHLFLQALDDKLKSALSGEYESVQTGITDAENEVKDRLE